MSDAWLLQLTTLFATSKPVLLFAVVGLGYLIGSVRLFNARLGVAAVLFTGLFFGALAPGRIVLPATIAEIGLVLFVYMTGLQAGPGCFSALAKRGLAINLVACAAIGAAVLTAVGLGRLFSLSRETIAGLFCGALTNTPALAAAIESLKGTSSDPAGAVSAYSTAYPFAVVGTLIVLHGAARFLRIDFGAEVTHLRAETEEKQTLVVRNYLVTSRVIERNSATADVIMGQTGVALSRYRRGKEVFPVESTTILKRGDVVVAVGTKSQLAHVALLLGEETQERLEQSREKLDYRRMYVSNPAAIGRPIGEFLELHTWGASITRVRRGDVEFVPNRATILEMGDRIRVVAYTNRLRDVTLFFGDSEKAVSESEILSPALGMVLGVLVGLIPVPIPGGQFMLGFAGGPLLVALVLGKLGRTGFVTWSIPTPVNLSLRQFGLLLFLATIGVNSGGVFRDHLIGNGWVLLISGALITLVSVIVSVLLARMCLRLEMTRVAGLVAGIQTQPAVLAAANTMTNSDLPNISYAAVFPFALIAKIAAVQMLLAFL